MTFVEIAKEPPKTANTCRVCAISRDLEDQPAEVEALNRLLSDPRWSYPKLAEVLSGEGFDVSLRGIERHINGQCSGRKNQGHMRGTV